MRVVVAIDAMGGDNAPRSVIRGVSLALKNTIDKSVDVFFRFYGRKSEIESFLCDIPDGRCELIDVPDVISSDAKPSSTIRHGRSSSMYVAIESVVSGSSDCIISAGNTGAMVVLSKYMMGMLPGVSRPVIAGVVPCAAGDFVMLDLGANVDCDAESLFQFAVIGHVFAKSYFPERKIRVGLLNIGSEHIKGNDSVKEAYALISSIASSDMNFVGYVEPSDVIIDNKADVVIVDGFSGNLAIKSSEAYVRSVMIELKRTAKSSLLGSIAMSIAKPFILRAFERFNPSRRNGAMLAGVKGVVIKSHGSATAEDFSYAVGVAVKLVIDKVNERIVREMGVSV